MFDLRQWYILIFFTIHITFTFHPCNQVVVEAFSCAPQAQTIPSASSFKKLRVQVPTSNNNDILLCNRRNHSLYMLRNFDLPEALIFYGIDTVLKLEPCIPPTTINESENISSTNTLGTESKSKSIISSKYSYEIKPGVLRLIKESKDIGTPVIVLSEHLTMDEIANILGSVDEVFSTYHQEQTLHYRTSREEYIFDYKERMNYFIDGDGDNENNDDDDDFEPPLTFQGQGFGHAPSPGAVIDAISSILINPRGFGGSSGFGTKYADAVRNPLLQHCVVFVSRSSDDNPINEKGCEYDGTGSLSRDRCIASRTAGMRVMYIEDDYENSCTAEDVSDGIVETLGSENDWSMVNLDDISTPGSFWLNMAQARDVNGDRVYSQDLIDHYVRIRKSQAGKTSKQVETDMEQVSSTKELDESDIEKILADLDSL